MGIWIWVLFGFVAGLVAAEILYLVFRRGPSPEPEVVEDDTPAQLARAQAKTAVLEDRLRVEEDSRAQWRASLEVENQEKLEAASMAYGERLTAAEADYSQKLEAAESQHQENLAAAEVECQAKLKAAEDQYRERLALLKLQFDNLESAFAAAELADEDETGSSAGAVLAGAATAVVVGALAGDEDLDSDVDETDLDSEGLEAGDAAGAERMPGSAALAAAAAAVLAVDEDEEEDADVDVEPDKLLTGAEQEIDELLPADVETTLVEGGAATSLAELERLEASKAEQASAAVQYAYDLQDEAEAATSRADDHAAAIMMAALAARAAARKAQEEDAAITERSLAAAPLADDTEVAEADEVEADVADLDLPTTEPELQDGDEGAEAVETGEQEAVESDLEDTAVEEPVEVEEDVRAETGEVPTAAEPLWPEDNSTWHGEYFNNMTLAGEPVLVREDAEIDFDWGMGSPAPAIDDDGFSVRWTRTATLRPGLYRFTVTSDDGARLWVNERLVISAWYDHTEMTFRREMELPGGPVDLRLEYYEKSMLAMVRISWERIG